VSELLVVSESAAFRKSLKTATKIKERNKRIMKSNLKPIKVNSSSTI
jgi:hypothetical protein